MPHTAASLWSGCIKATKTLVDAGWDNKPAYVALRATATALERLPSCTEREWKEIVLKLRVPYHVGVACTQCVDGCGFITMDVAGCMMGILRILVGKAFNMDNHSLMLATIQQLQESGLLEQLPSLLSAVAAGLTAAETGLPDACLTDAQRVMKQHLGLVLASNAAQVAAQFRGWARCLVLTMAWLHNMTTRLREPDVTGRTYYCPEVFSHHSALSIADIVLALARDISGNLSPTNSPDPAMLTALVLACECMERLCCSHVHGLLPHGKKQRHDACLKADVKQVLLSSSLGPSLALVLAAVACNWPAQQRQPRDVQAEGSTSGSSPDSKSNAVDGAAVQLAWQHANLQALSLPASHLQLCMQLGIDVILVMVVGRLLRVQTFKHTADYVLSDVLFETLMRILETWRLSSRRALWEQKPAAQQELELQLQLLLPGVLLHCASKMPHQAASRRFSKNCVHAMQQSISGASAWRSLTRAAGSLEEQQQPWPLQAAWVAEVVPAALKLACRLLPQLQEDADSASGTAAVGAEAVDDSSATGRQGVQASRTEPRELDWSEAHLPAECLIKVLMFLGLVCDAVAPAGSLEQSDGGLGHTTSR